MFDLRYHVASLAAVFFALVIGILVGVALASHGLGNSERLNLEHQITDAQNRISALNGELTTANENMRAGTSFLTNAYKAVMADRLAGKHIAVLSIGPVDPKLRSAVARTITDAGGTILRLRAITVPLQLDRLNVVLRKKRQLKAYAGKPKDIGRELADELVLGGDTPLWSALESQLVEERTGSPKQPADGVVVIRSAPQQTDGTSKFIGALLAELASRPAAVALELSNARPSFVPVYEAVGLSSVDDGDTPAGRVATAVVLAGGILSDAHYGTRAGDDEVLPAVPPVSAGTSTTGG